MSNPVVALIYDFDKTLSPGDMQEYGFMPVIKSNPDEFWAMCAEFKKQHDSDGILAYMYMMIHKARDLEFTRERLHEMGRDVEFYPGVEGWFDRVNAIGEACGVQVEHYIISSGLTEIIKGSRIGDRFKAVFAASFCYDEDGRPMWPATAVNYTSKTQYLFRINKGILEVTNDSDLNAYTPHSKRRIPFSNMIYIGDGLTDVPCMKMTRQRGGYSIAVHAPGSTEISDDMLLQDRADFAVLADYSEGSELEEIAGELFRRIRATHDLTQRRERHVRAAYERRGGSANPPATGMRGGLLEEYDLENLE